jgi:hypothetical protein
MATFCSSCGTALKEGARFCASCGAAVMASVELNQANAAATVNPSVSEPQYSADGNWWWDGKHWTARLAMPEVKVATVEGTKLRKNAWGLPPGEYTTDRKWRLENATWVAAGKWKWDGKTFIKVAESKVGKNETGPDAKLLSYGRHLIFRDGKSQLVDANRKATSWRM